MEIADRIKRIWSLYRSKDAYTRKDNQHPVASYDNVFAVSFTGEKNPGEMGPVIDYKPDFSILSLRSWQSYLESEITQTILKKFATWVIGSGLKLQAEPVKRVLESEGINIGSEEFNEITEARFSVFAKSNNADYSSMRTLHKIAYRTFVNATISGDVLVILRYIGGVKVQLVDGCHIKSPNINHDLYRSAISAGNRILNGVEISPSGEHIAYYICKGLFDFERIPARSKSSGLTVAFLVYGLEFRLDSTRGLPLIAAVLETIKKLERYKEATVGSAEERQKIAYTIEHGVASTGEAPFSKGVIARAFNADSTQEVPTDDLGNKLADRMAVSMNKSVYNMPIDSHLKSFESKNELYFKDFYTVNIDLVCAALQIPPEVAMSKYNSNFSASRAALKDWEHTIVTTRNNFAAEFYQRIYAYWLEVEILNFKIQAPGYLEAKYTSNYTVLDAYRNARFVGASVPHIDPLKEVNAERLKLGETGKNIPLTTVEAATEALNGGDSDQNMEQYAEEYKMAKRLGFIKEANASKITNGTT